MSFIPKPRFCEALAGDCVLQDVILVAFNHSALEPAARILLHHLTHRLHASAVLHPDPSGAGISLLLVDSLPLLAQLEVPEEGYELDVRDGSAGGIVVRATTLLGCTYGVASLLQLMPASSPTDGRLTLPCLKVADAPRFRWRGLLMDVGRHFYSVEFIKRMLDMMAMYKMNYFHWHLTEDQGWRIEIKSYPKLTEFGAWRVGAGGDKYGGFYTQDQVREVVSYAACLGIEVVPEIELPGHCGAALASYPWLSCTGGVRNVPTRWGVHEDVYCAAKEEVFEFLQGVLSEVLDLFPCKYVHIGGDECPKSRWASCEGCQQRIAAERLGNEDGLQSWFVSRMGAWLEDRGRRFIGWDEILEGGLAKGAIVMSWRGIGGGVEAARAGHQVIMCPTSHCYLDYRQDNSDAEPGAWYAVLPLEAVYAFDPVPPEPERLEQDTAAGSPAQLYPPPPSDVNSPALPLESAPSFDIPSDSAAALDTSASGHSLGSSLASASSSGEGSADDSTAEGTPEGTAEETTASVSVAGGAVVGGGGGGGGAAAGGRHQWSLSAADARNILGGQANLWTEFISDEGTAEYMVLPRMAAMAEALWSSKHAKDWPCFKQRLTSHQDHYRARGWRFRAVPE